MTAQPLLIQEMRQEVSDIAAREQAIVQSVLANADLLAMWVRSNRLAAEHGTAGWATLAELKRRRDVPR